MRALFSLAVIRLRLSAITLAAAIMFCRTARSARFSSGLSVLDFLKRTSILKCDAQSLRKIGSAAVTLGEAEGLQAHARSVSIRLNQSED